MLQAPIETKRSSKQAPSPADATGQQTDDSSLWKSASQLVNGLNGLLQQQVRGLPAAAESDLVSSCAMLYLNSTSMIHVHVFLYFQPTTGTACASIRALATSSENCVALLDASVHACCRYDKGYIWYLQ